MTCPDISSGILPWAFLIAGVSVIFALCAVIGEIRQKARNNELERELWMRNSWRWLYGSRSKDSAKQ